MGRNKVFLDTNVLMDFLFNRDIQAESTDIIMQLGADGVHENCISVLSLVTVAYVARKFLPKEKIEPVLKDCSGLFTILSVSASQHDLALSYKGDDYEDKLQMACAKESGCRYIISRNVKDFAGTPGIPVYTPDEFVARLKMQAPCPRI